MSVYNISACTKVVGFEEWYADFLTMGISSLVGGPMGIQLPFSRSEFCDESKTEVFRDIHDGSNIVMYFANVNNAKKVEFFESAGFKTVTQKTVPDPISMWMQVDLESCSETISPRFCSILETADFGVWYKAFIAHGTSPMLASFDVSITRKKLCYDTKIFRSVKNPNKVYVLLSNTNMSLMKNLFANPNFENAQAEIGVKRELRFLEVVIPELPPTLMYVKPSAQVACSVSDCKNWTFGQSNDKCKAHSVKSHTNGARGTGLIKNIGPIKCPTTKSALNFGTIPDVVRLFFDGNPMELKRSAIMEGLSDDFQHTTDGQIIFNKASFLGACLHLCEAAPDFTFNVGSRDKTKRVQVPFLNDDNGWEADITVGGHHIYKPFTCKYGVLPPIMANTEDNVMPTRAFFKVRAIMFLGPNGKANRLEFKTIDTVNDYNKNINILQNFYLQIGGSLTPPTPPPELLEANLTAIVSTEYNEIIAVDDF